MNDGLAVLVALLFLSAMLSGILTIAWATIGPARHALTWAIAFGLAAAEWGIILASRTLGDNPIRFLIVNIFSAAVTVLLAIGFRQRSGAAERRLAMTLAGAAMVAIAFAAPYVVPHAAIGRATPLLFRAILLAIAAAAVVPRGRPANAAERSMVAMLWLCVLFDIAVASVALATGGHGGRFAGLDHWMLLFGLPTAFAGTGLFAVFLLAADLAERMRLLAARDPLTGILNRRGFEEEAGRVIANAARHGQPLSLAIADLDRFKAVNDMYGHAAGDAVLRRFADDVGDAVRLGDLFGRLGGEEFVLLLVNTPGEAAVAVIDRLRRDVARQDLATEPPMRVTTSFGVAELAPGEGSLDALLARADRALYRSKLAGRDRVTFARDEAAVCRGAAE